LAVRHWVGKTQLSVLELECAVTDFRAAFLLHTRILMRSLLISQSFRSIAGHRVWALVSNRFLTFRPIKGSLVENEVLFVGKLRHL